MNERTGLVTLKGNPMTLVGDEIKVGEKAPDFQLTGTDMNSKSLSDYQGKVKIVTVVPSLDTAVCDTEVRTFNEKATSLDDNIVVLTVSMDLPPAQKRWCGAAGVDRVECLSDYKDHSFGKAWGVRMKEIGFLARSVFVLDKDNVVRYMELVPEITQEPNYDEALTAAKELV